MFQGMLTFSGDILAISEGGIQFSRLTKKEDKHSSIKVINLQPFKKIYTFKYESMQSIWYAISSMSRDYLYIHLLIFHQTKFVQIVFCIGMSFSNIWC